MKIAHVTPSFHPAHYYGGPSYSTFGLCKALAAAGAEVRVLTTNANGPKERLNIDTRRELEIAPRLSARYCNRWIAESVSPALLHHLPALIDWADVVHLTAVYNFTTFPVFISCKRRNKPLVWSPRGALLRWKHSRRRLAKEVWELGCRRTAPRKMIVHVTSDMEARAVRERFAVAPPVIIPNGVDIPQATVRTPGDGLRLAYLGRLDPIKGVENLIEACFLLEPALQSWTLQIAGSGDPHYTASLQAKVRERGLQQRIRFVGDVRSDAKTAFLRSVDLLVVPSFSENFGIVVAEGLAHGVPVIASKGTPWPRLEAEGCGLWVQNDSTTLAAAVRHMASMQLSKMGDAGRAWMEREFSWSSVSRRMYEAYAQLAADSARGDLAS